tara:strand:+ start:2137 stop:2382 length:246 start_codon:yes stop_codon:yes gene_type:complete
MPTAEENAFEQAKAILGEHFQHYAIVSQDEEGNVWREGDNDLVEKALYKTALDMIKECEQIESMDCEIDWDDDDDDGGCVF